MPLPSIDLSALPDLAHFTGTQMTGIFGSHTVPVGGPDDSIVILATFLYETGGGTG